ncbi:MAG TPA: PHB depolymerase family esterase [Thermoanaerobaculia bacterium]|nr:PHB depolymerase family esterase [Thermoanaerobaculia bacterium]
MRLIVTLLALPLLVVAILGAAFFVRNRNNGSIVVDGEQRNYLVHVPPGYDRSRAVPLVISMHGAGGWPAQQMRMTQWNRVADRAGFIVVYPSGADMAGPRIWRVSDVDYISQLIDRLERDYNVDRSRVYANGFSNGGGMTFILSCTISDRLAAVGLAGAAQPLPWKWCRDTKPLPMIAIHGTDDHFAPYEGGQSPIMPPGQLFPSIPVWVSKWAARNRCAPQPAASHIARDVTRTTYSPCAADVVFYTVEGGCHQWFGGRPLPEWFVGHDPRTIDTTAEMWAFFQKHRR